MARIVGAAIDLEVRERAGGQLDLRSIAIGRTVFDEAETGPEIEGSGVFEGERHFVLTHHTGVHCILTGEIAAIGEHADGKRVGAGGGRGEGENGNGDWAANTDLNEDTLDCVQQDAEEGVQRHWSRSRERET